jgi:predicted PurR-regulated permease PerM
MKPAPVTDTLQHLAAGMILALAAGYLLHVGRSIIVPLVLALFIAYVIWTLVEWLRAAPVIGPYLPDWVAHIGALVLMTGVIWGLVMLVTQNIAMVEEQLPTYRENAEAWLVWVANILELGYVPTFEQLRDTVYERLDMGRLVGGAVGLVTALLGNLMVVLIYTVFVLIERVALVQKLERLTGSAAGGERMAATLREIGGRIGRYLALKTFVSAVVAIASWIIMRLIGIDFAEFWAVLIFILNFIPYVGSFVAVLLPVLLTLVQFGAPGPFLVALVGLTGVQMVVGNFVEPRLMGNSLNLSPIVILLSLAAWSALWGVVGAFLCVPITVVMLIVFSEFEATRSLAILLSQDGRIRPEEPQAL